MTQWQSWNEAVIRAWLRAVRLTVAPNEEWRTIRDEKPRARAILALFVLPLALIPAASWSLGLLLFGDDGRSARNGVAFGIAQVVHGGLIAFFGVVLSICLCALSILVLAPLFSCLRDWRRALQVAAYSAAPVLIGGLVLILPDLVYTLILAFFHSLYLQYAGLQHVLAVKERDAAEYVALSTVLLMVFSTVMGALGGWLGVL